MKCTAEQILAMTQDSSYHDLGTLPSNGIPYGQRNLQIFIRPFQLAELRLLSRAVDLDEASHLLRAVDNCISLPVEELTIGDFFYVLLWLRLYSMPKSPYIVEWKCNQPYFTHKETKKPLFYTEEDWPTVEQLKADYNVEPCETENTSIVHDTSVDIISLPDDFELPQGFDFPRMACYEERSKAMRDPEWSQLAPAIQWLPGLTWAEKVEYASHSPEVIGEALDLNRRISFGISEEATFNCRRCRVEHTTKLRLDALSFFQ